MVITMNNKETNHPLVYWNPERLEIFSQVSDGQEWTKGGRSFGVTVDRRLDTIDRLLEGGDRTTKED